MMPESIIINFVCICFAVHVCKVVGREGGGGSIDSEGHTMALKVGYWGRSWDINRQISMYFVGCQKLLIMHYFLFHLCLISCNLQIRCTGEGIQCLYQYMNYTFECGLIVQCTNFAIKWERLICVGVLCGGFCPH